MKYLGDFPINHAAVCIPFDSFAAATGAPSATTNFAAGDVVIFKDGGTTQRTSSNGITVSTSFDSNTGLQMIVIDLSDNTDAGFYAAGHEYQVAVADITIDTQTVRFWAGTFSIERAGGALAVVKSRLPAALTSNGNMKSSILEIISTALSEGAAGRIAAAWQAFWNVTSPVATAQTVNQTGDGYARLGAPAGASHAADVAAVKTDTAAVKVKTDKLPNVALASGAVVNDAANSATTFLTDLTETETNHWKDAFLTFTTGALTGQTRKITAYNGSTKFVTTAAFSAEPADTDEFDIINK